MNIISSMDVTPLLWTRLLMADLTSDLGPCLDCLVLEFILLKTPRKGLFVF